jgi:hypothetical protein
MRTKELVPLQCGNYIPCGQGFKSNILSVCDPVCVKIPIVKVNTLNRKKGEPHELLPLCLGAMEQSALYRNMCPHNCHLTDGTL